ncbi:HAD family hydrolase [Parasphingorhabdus pacifica]
MTFHSSGPTVGFDLDLTLIDARPGIVRMFDLLNQEFDLRIDGERFAANLGPPLPDVLREYGFESPLVDALVARFRELYPSVVIDRTTSMPGADAALDAVREASGRTLVITGKYEPNAALHLKAMEWHVDHLCGDVYAADKGAALREQGASIYVGDHLGDILGARSAGATAVGVATGPFDAEALREAGADVVLHDLTEFPSWLFAR